MYIDIHNTDRKYSIIYADPPWSYSDKKCNGAAAAQYSTMPIADICALPVANLAADDCVLFLWTTYPMLPEALKLIEAWGFKYKSIAFQWLKLNRGGRGWFFGLGRWTRGNTEPCLIATKGKPQRASNSVGQIIEHPLGRHSAKPPQTRDKIMELMGGGAAIELFARSSAAGWDVWGNQAPDGEEPQPETSFLPSAKRAQADVAQMTLFNCEGVLSNG